MLPNLGRLSLCHREAATSADDEGPLGKRGGKAALHPIAEEGSSSSDPDPKRPRAAANRYPPPSKTIEVLPGGKPTPSGEPTRASNAFDEADDPETDPGYKAHLEDHNELVENGREELRKRFPLEKVTPLDKSVYENYKEFFQNVLTVDEPPNRHLFSAYGKGAPIHYLRLGPNSVLTMQDPVFQREVSMPAFRALKLLRDHFGNVPSSDAGCGSYNCFTNKVELYGPHEHQLALRAILFALRPSTTPANGQTTVAIRSPAEAFVSGYNHVKTTQNRHEVGLTLRAAAVDVAPPVYAVIPMKVISMHGELAQRGYAYVFEDGWTDLSTILDTVRAVHTWDNEVHMAYLHIGQAVDQLLTDLSKKTGYLMLDMKSANLVGRRLFEIHDTMYAMRAIDFSSDFAAEANLRDDARATSDDCILFVNTLLLLSQIKENRPQFMHVFMRSASKMKTLWETMTREGDSFCKLLDADEESGPDYTDDQESLMEAEPEEFHAKLRRVFYRFVHQYGDASVIEEADLNVTLLGPTSRFITRYVFVLHSEYNQAWRSEHEMDRGPSIAVETDDDGS